MKKADLIFNLSFLTLRRVKLSVVLLFTVCAALFFINCARPTQPPVTTEEQVDSDEVAPVYAKLPGNSADYGVFSHKIKEHADFQCNVCHQRADNSISPDYAGHSSCINCHLEQFIAEDAKICAICHKDVKSAPAPMKNFPATFIEQFNMKFDHAVHQRPGAEPKEGCAFCHKQLNGPSLSIPVGISAHNECYVCHTADKIVGKKNIGTCNTCHATAPYTRTSTAGAAFKTSFTHDNHRQVDCMDCHTVRAGAPQLQQVGSPIAKEHNYGGGATACASCHNGQRAFSGTDFTSCRRCHLGQTFSQVPAL